MNCFSHPHNNAFGIFRVCGKGVCSECSVDLGHALACKGVHESRASEMHALQLRSTKLLKVTRKSMFIGPLFFGLLGLFFLVEGLGQEIYFNFATYSGATCVLLAVASLITNMRAYGGSEQNDS
ncbi:hypothetical protein [Massilia rubra]|uniref:B box-type domain-containing protein n=1 Tax=Massilia rubra TaxID=2607910 RepID=A0ABX0LHQ3_9BURK|nr:hypothetical protein [Massilia rubra]NHZ33620.1 hypothetical protein [Massilia rubra]